MPGPGGTQRGFVMRGREICPQPTLSPAHSRRGGWPSRRPTRSRPQRLPDLVWGVPTLDGVMPISGTASGAGRLWGSPVPARRAHHGARSAHHNARRAHHGARRAHHGARSAHHNAHRAHHGARDAWRTIGSPRAPPGFRSGDSSRTGGNRMALIRHSAHFCPTQAGWETTLTPVPSATQDIQVQNQNLLG